LEKNNPDRLKQGWEMVKRNMGRIRSLVLDLLYYAKDREPEWENLSASSLGEEVFSLMHLKAREYGIEMKGDLDQNAGDFEGDPKAIRSLLINLMENSLDACRVDKKKSAHQVHLGLGGDSEFVQFEIRDNGIGMDQEAREKAFTLFFSSKRGNGTGLGLFISNKIARAHGGEIKMESELHQGTRLIVKLPRRRLILKSPASNPL
jgi:signal transduction histidine kinase